MLLRRRQREDPLERLPGLRQPAHERERRTQRMQRRNDLRPGAERRTTFRLECAGSLAGAPMAGAGDARSGSPRSRRRSGSRASDRDADSITLMHGESDRRERDHDRLRTVGNHWHRIGRHICVIRIAGCRASIGDAFTVRKAQEKRFNDITSSLQDVKKAQDNLQANFEVAVVNKLPAAKLMYLKLAHRLVVVMKQIELLRLRHRNVSSIEEEVA